MIHVGFNNIHISSWMVFAVVSKTKRKMQRKTEIYL